MLGTSRATDAASSAATPLRVSGADYSGTGGRRTEFRERQDEEDEADGKRQTRCRQPNGRAGERTGRAGYAPTVTPEHEHALSLLGLPKTATIKDAQKTYRKLARKLHPDIAGEDSVDAFQKVKKAWEVVVEEVEIQSLVETNTGTLTQAEANKLRSVYGELEEERRKIKEDSAKRLEGLKSFVYARVDVIGAVSLTAVAGKMAGML